MAGPPSNLVATFRRCGEQRYEEAQVLRKAGKTTGAVYLAGYGVECVLKALVLSATSAAAEPEMMTTFRGRRAHDYDRLRSQYREQGGADLPRDIVRQFLLVSSWSTDLRYLTRSYRVPETDRFMAAALAIILWAKGRL